MPAPEPGAGLRQPGPGGRSTLSHRAEGLCDTLRQRLAARPAGSGTAHLLIQFGHNDQPGKPGKPGRSTDLATEYPANLTRYVADARASGAVPVLVTPLARRSFAGERLADQLAPPGPMRCARWRTPRAWRWWTCMH